MILHVVKSLVRLPSLHTLGFVGVIVGGTGSDVRLVDGVLRGGFVGHPVVPEGYQKLTLNERQKRLHPPHQSLDIPPLENIEIVKNNMIEKISQGIEGQV